MLLLNIFGHLLSWTSAKIEVCDASFSSKVFWAFYVFFREFEICYVGVAVRDFLFTFDVCPSNSKDLKMVFLDIIEEEVLVVIFLAFPHIQYTNI